MSSQSWEPLIYTNKIVFEDHTEEMTINWVLMIRNNFLTCEGEGVGKHFTYQEQNVQVMLMFCDWQVFLQVERNKIWAGKLGQWQNAMGFVFLLCSLTFILMSVKR